LSLSLHPKSLEIAASYNLHTGWVHLTADQSNNRATPTTPPAIISLATRSRVAAPVGLAAALALDGAGLAAGVVDVGVDIGDDVSTAELVCCTTLDATLDAAGDAPLDAATTADDAVPTPKLVTPAVALTVTLPTPLLPLLVTTAPALILLCKLLSPAAYDA
jgi:hypothetical protein